jgi:hypothetical protein
VRGKQELFLPIIYFFLIILVILGITWANSHFLQPIPQFDDFKIAWSGANTWLLGGNNPYQDVARFDFPLTAMVFFGPLGLLNYSLAHAIWLTIVEVSLIFLTLLLVLASLAFYFCVRSIILGQSTILVLLIIFVGFSLIIRKQDGIAGFIFSFAIVNPELSLLPIIFVLFWSLAAKRHALLLSLLASLTFLLIIFVILMPDWPLQWLQVTIGGIGATYWRSSVLSAIANRVPGIWMPLIIVLNSGFLVLLLVEWIRSIKNAESMFLWLAMITITVNTLIRLRADASDLVGLLPVLFYILHGLRERWRAIGDAAALFFSSVLLVVPWAMRINSDQSGSGEPLALRILIPIVCLLSLYWIKWWVIRPRRLPLERLKDRLG